MEYLLLYLFIFIISIPFMFAKVLPSSGTQVLQIQEKRVELEQNSDLVFLPVY